MILSIQFDRLGEIGVFLSKAPETTMQRIGWVFYKIRLKEYSDMQIIVTDWVFNDKKLAIRRSMEGQPPGHEKIIMRIARPSMFDKLYSYWEDKTVKAWDCTATLALGLEDPLRYIKYFPFNDGSLYIPTDEVKHNV